MTFYFQAKIPSEIFQNAQSYSWTRPNCWAAKLGNRKHYCKTAKIVISSD